jgi:hypothetical protein
MFRYDAPDKRLFEEARDAGGAVNGLLQLFDYPGEMLRFILRLESGIAFSARFAWIAISSSAMLGEPTRNFSDSNSIRGAIRDNTSALISLL